MNGIEGLPLAAQTNIDGWVVACDECGRQQHFDHVARARVVDAARAAGWTLGVERRCEGDPLGIGPAVVEVKDIAICPRCRIGS